MKDTKRRMEFFSFYNHTGIAAHLTKMAKKGWMIESITNAYWTYRKIEPKYIHFSVSYYPIIGCTGMWREAPPLRI